MLSLLVVLLSVTNSGASDRQKTSHHQIKKSYVKSADEGLHFSTITATLDEWNKTFHGKPIDSRTLARTQPLLIWMRCIDDELRGYFTFEQPDPHPDCGHTSVEMSVNANIMKDSVKLLVDGQRIYYMSDVVGQAFTTSVSAVTTSHVVISIEGWLRYASFPMSECQQSSDFESPIKIGQPRDPKLVIVVTTPDTFNISQKSLFTRMVSNHILYNRCALGIQGYEVIEQHDHIDKYLQNPHLRHYLDMGWLTLFTKPSQPSRRMLAKDYSRQSLYENLAILRHWKKDVYIMNLDPDEYLLYPTDIFTNSSSFRDMIFSHGNLVIDRWNTYCISGCTHDHVDGAVSFTAPRSYGKEKELTLTRYPKLVYDVERNSGSFVHHMTMQTGDNFHLPNTTALILHLQNLFNFRVQTNFTENPDMLDPVDLDHPLLKTCNPAHPDAKMMKY